ncbi:hypothetical protein G6F56_008425 [Rhizopus delemar]|uniref:FAS1 domain-containing protein n=1 Tax=Rhizopus stolonifer TaxID=4846 RepID=A0A367J230_RHIST|nr:hypothetical protein G6F56_008425 [Rhizopus delemar]RCH83771.1 hypothetical protein CU098_009158 [Rhizopus stolonifer]
MMQFLCLLLLIPLVFSQKLFYEPSVPDYRASSVNQSLFDKLAPDSSLSTFMDVLTQIEDIFNLLNHTDITNDQQFTVFCPVNNAFREELDIYTRSHLRDFLRNHIVLGKLDPEALAKTHSVDTLLPGQTISIKYHFFSKKTILNGHAVVDTNVEAVNGIAYKINHLLRPVQS